MSGTIAMRVLPKSKKTKIIEEEKPVQILPEQPKETDSEEEKMRKKKLLLNRLAGIGQPT